MIVKVQQSLRPTSRLLIYDKDRTITWQGPLTDEIKSLLGPKPKMYFHAHVDKAGKIVLGRVADKQDW